MLLALATLIAPLRADASTDFTTEAFVRGSHAFEAPPAAFEATGACVARVESADTSLDVRAFDASGASLVEPASAVGRVHVRLIRGRGERTYLVVRTAAPSRVRVSFAPSAMDAPLPSDGGASTPRTVPVGPSVDATASRRVAARRDALIPVGFVGSDVTLARDVLDVPAFEGECALALVSVDGGAITVGPASLASGGDATWMICDHAEALPIAASSGRPSVAVAWLVPRNPSAAQTNPSTFLLTTELVARGFSRFSVSRLLALDALRPVAVPVHLDAGECVAVAAIGDAGLVTLSLSDTNGSLLGRSQSGEPASRVYRCAASAEDVFATVVSERGSFDARLVVARSAP